MGRSGFARCKTSQDMISRRLVREDLELCAEPEHFFNNNCPDTVHGAFIMRWGLGFNEGFEKFS